MLNERVSERDKNLIHVLSVAEDLKTITPQEQKILIFFYRGMHPRTIAIQTGASRDRIDSLINSDRGQRVLEALAERDTRDLAITRERLTAMLLDAHSHSATATEEISAIRELGKLHDLYLDNKKQIDINVNQKITNYTQIERATEEQLIELAGETIDLDPDSYKIEYEYEEEEAADFEEVDADAEELEEEDFAENNG